jgi:hypothetical protein
MSRRAPSGCDQQGRLPTREPHEIAAEAATELGAEPEGEAEGNEPEEGWDFSDLFWALVVVGLSAAATVVLAHAAKSAASRMFGF